ncbi:MAG: protein kinase [Acidobacteria bacterium]|nr:protein kinase [Acidobacteriota bacterium]
MKPERWRQIEQTYHAALELAPDQRSGFLDQVCAGDEELRREVVSLLASHDEANSFIEKAPDDVIAGMIAEEQARSIIGRTLDHYQVRSLLGQGGMGEVYRAHDTRLDRDVAVKILPEHLASDAEALRRFEREAKAIAALSHPNILSIFDFGNEQGMSYAVTELLEGETLRSFLSCSSPEWQCAATIGEAIAEGLAAAHIKGIIHRDIKPENIFLTSGGQVKILDFGIARVKHEVSPYSETLTSAVKTTMPGTVIGTIGYMSPEQTRGEEADSQSDIFSLGCLLYEMVSGKSPFARETAAETIAAILKEEPPTITGRGKDFPEVLERIIRHCLEKRPGERFQSALELANDLRAVLSGDNVATPKPAPLLAKYRSRFVAWVATAIISLIVGVVVLVYLSSGRSKAIDSIAVLPLINASGNAELEYLSDGISESLINSLSQLPQLRVMARSTVFNYKGKEVDPRKVGQELNVRAVFTGKMVQRGDALSIQADLVNASDGSQLWGERYVRKLSDILALQEEMAKQISEKLQLRLSGAEQQRLTKRYTKNTEAYQLYLKGRYYSSQFTTEGLKKGIDYLNRAVEADPAYALAYAGLSASYFDASNIVFPADEALPKVQAAALRALQMDETLAEAHVTVALVKERYEWNWTEAERGYKRAMELSPNDARVLQWYGFYLAEQGRLDEAIATMARARDIDPLTPYTSSTLAYFHYLARRNDEAIAQLQKMIRMDPNFVVAHYTLGLAYEQKEMFEHAISEFNQAQRLDPEGWAPPAFLARTYALWGKRDEAQRRLEELKRIAEEKHVDPYNIGVIHASLGEIDQAFAWLDKAYRIKSEELLMIKVDPRLENLRSDPRFNDLVRRLNLSP